MKRITVIVTPRSSKNEMLQSREDGILRIKLKAPPVDGEANKALIAFLATQWGVKKSQLRIVQGEKGRRKVVEVCSKEDAD